MNRLLRTFYHHFTLRVSVRMTAWLLVVYLLLVRDFTPLSIIAGLLLCLAIQVVFPMPHVGAWRRLRPWHLLVLVTVFMRDMIVAALQVSWIVIRRKPAQPIAVSVQLYSSSELYLTMVAAMTCLVPGSIVVRAQLAPSRILLHVLDSDMSGGASGVARDIHRLEMRIMRALATPDQLEAAAASRKRYLESERVIKPDAESWQPSPEAKAQVAQEAQFEEVKQ